MEVKEPKIIQKKYAYKQEQIWRTMRMLKIFSLQELALHASIEHSIVHVDTVNVYVNILRKAGYLKHYSTGKNKVKFWQLVYNTGAKHPKMSIQNNIVYDRNLEKIVNPAVLWEWKAKQYC